MTAAAATPTLPPTSKPRRTRAARRARDLLIAHLIMAGVKDAEIWEAAGVSPRHYRRILASRAFRDLFAEVQAGVSAAMTKVIVAELARNMYDAHRYGESALPELVRKAREALRDRLLPPVTSSEGAPHAWSHTRD